jgi:hypothetical protein
MTKNSVTFDRSIFKAGRDASTKVKLPTHPVRTGQARRGLPEEEVSLIVCPFLPAGRQGLRLQGGASGARFGQR